MICGRFSTIPLLILPEELGLPTSDGSSMLFPRLLMLPLGVPHDVLLGVRLPYV